MTYNSNGKKSLEDDEKSLSQFRKVMEEPWGRDPYIFVACEKAD
jgi:hypothetical protein